MIRDLLFARRGPDGFDLAVDYPSRAISLVRAARSEQRWRLANRGARAACPFVPLGPVPVACPS